MYMLNIKCLFTIIGFREQALVVSALSMKPEFGGALLGCFSEQHHTPRAGKSQPLWSRTDWEHRAPMDPAPLGRKG